jgi:hypothetical protein
MSCKKTTRPARRSIVIVGGVLTCISLLNSLGLSNDISARPNRKKRPTRRSERNDRSTVTPSTREREARKSIPEELPERGAGESDRVKEKPVTGDSGPPATSTVTDATRKPTSNTLSVMERYIHALMKRYILAKESEDADDQIQKQESGSSNKDTSTANDPNGNNQMNKQVAVCITGFPGPSYAAKALKHNIINPLNADLFLVSPAYHPELNNEFTPGVHMNNATNIDTAPGAGGQSNSGATGSGDTEDSERKKEPVKEQTEEEQKIEEWTHLRSLFRFPWLEKKNEEPISDTFPVVTAAMRG